MVAGHVIQKVMHVFYTMHGSPPPPSVIPLQISASHWATIIYVIIGLLLRASYTDRSSYRLRLPISQYSNPKTIAVIFHYLSPTLEKVVKTVKRRGEYMGYQSVVRIDYPSEAGRYVKQCIMCYCNHHIGTSIAKRPWVSWLWRDQPVDKLNNVLPTVQTFQASIE